MRQHLVIWSLTAMILLVAAMLTVLRTSQMGDATGRPAADLQDALQSAIDLLAEDPSVAEAATQDAVRAATVRAMESRQSSAEAAYLVALQYQREQNLRGAEAYYKRAIALRPEWSDPHAGLGWLLGVHAMDRSGEAMALIRKAIALDPEASRPHIALAVLLRLEGRLDEAELSALEALRLDPNSVPSHNNYANLLIRREEYEKAEQHYMKAIAIDPDSTKPYYNLACLYSLTDRTEEALDYLAQAVELDPLYRTQALTDPDLDALRDLPEFTRLVFQRDADTAGQDSPDGLE